MLRIYLAVFSLTLCLLPAQPSEDRSGVRVWEEDLVIPTWETGPPEVNPTFAWSSSRQEVYPYPYREILTERKVDKTYRACWLENEFIKVLILPDIGGRLHGAQDKTNGYNFFYWQPTIKPALVGMTGAWISGGIEWNFPHGHRPTGFSRVQHRIVDNPDGSKTVWVGEPELVNRVRWIVGLTVYPGKSIIEAKVRLSNPSPLRHSFQMWTTTATNANDEYQAVFPTRIMTGHGKFEYFHWPVNEGTDISWWKNVPNAASFFAVEPEAYFGGYDHGRNAGTVITGDPGIVVGKKFWTWGTSPSGRIWEPILTEDQGPYIEPQAGAYSDNQPDYHWIEPGEMKVYSHFFFPVRDIGPFDYANVNGAVSLRFEGDEVRLGVYSTTHLRNAEVRLTQNGETVYRSTKNLDPGNTLVEKLTVSGAEASSDTFQLEVVTTDGEELLRYSPQRLDQVELPEPRKPYDDPEEIETIDELWHAGNWTYKFRDTSQGIEYFEEALRRDPYDSRSRISLAELAIKHFKYDAALQHLDVAAVRDPDNGQIFYLRALAEESLGKYDAAYNHYYRATHFQSHLPRAYQRLAMLSLRKGNPEQATEHVNQAIRFNSLNPDLWVIRAISQRLSEMPEEAAVSAVRGLELDPISAWAARELGHAKEELGQSRSEEDRLVKQLLHDTQTAIEVALNYANCGLYGDAFDLLSLGPEDALSSYYRGFFKARSGQTEEAEQLFAQGSQLTPDYSFAFRSEAVDVFTTALQSNPDDGRAAYYLGLVYAKVSEIDQAVRYWKEATRRDPENARTWRDLGLAMSVQAKDAEGTEEKALLDSALEFYSKALESAPDDSRILLEHLAVQKAQDVPSAAQLSFLKQHEETVRKRDALIGSLVDLLIEDQQYAAALGYLEGNHFNSWEGGYGIHNSFIEANIGLAEQERDPELALAHYEKACTYPANLEVAPREPNLRGFLYVPMARLYGKLGNAEKARKLLEDSAREKSDYPTLGTYYQALALKELGRTEDSQQALAGLREEAELMLEGASENYNRINKDDRQALGHYYLAKVLEEEGESALSAEHLSAARKLEPGIGRIAIQVAQRAFARAHQ